MARSFPGGANTDRVNTSLTSYPPSSNQMSFSIWAYRNNPNGDASARRFFDKDGGAVQLWFAEDSNNFFTNPAENWINFERGFSTQAGSWRFFSGDQTSWEDRWMNIVLTYDGASTSNNPTVYLDGSALSESTADRQAPSGTLATSGSNPYRIGNRDDDSRCWDGKLAHFAVWHDVLLTAAEAGALAAGVSPLTIRPDKLVSYIPLYGASPEPDLAPDPAGATTITGTTVPPDSAPVGRPVPRSTWIPLLTALSSTSLFATGDGTIADVVDEADAATGLFDSVDDDPASPDDNDWVNNAVDVVP